jgi:DNA repair protein RadC
LLCKLEGLKEQRDIDFDIYRKTVFESINILLVDHLIVGENKYFSFNDNGLL